MTCRSASSRRTAFALAGLCTAACVLLTAPTALARTYQSQITEAHGAPFSSPQGLAVDGSNNLWVADPGRSLTDKFEPSGAFLLQSSGNGHLSGYAESIAYSDASEHLYVADSSADDLWVLNSDGTYNSDIKGPWGTGCCYVRTAADNSSGEAGGDVYVSGEGNSVYRIDSEGHPAPFKESGNPSDPYVEGAKLTGTGKGSFVSPAGLAVGPSGELFVISGNAVDEFEPSGTFVRAFSEAEGSPLGSITAVAVDPTNGNVLIAEGAAIDEFSATGEFLEDITEANGASLGSIQGLAVNSTGTLYASDRANGLIDVFGHAEPPLPRYLLKVEKTGPGTLTSSPSGIDCGTACSHNFKQGQVVILTAHPTERSTFAKWTGCPHELSATECEVEMTAAKSVEAKFTEVAQEELTVATEGTGVGSVTGTSPGSEFKEIDCGNGATTCAEKYNEKAMIILTAHPTERSTFAKWTGCPHELSATECEVEMTAAKSVEAKFEAIPQQILTVAVEGPGTVTGTSPGGEFTEIDCGNGATTCEATYNQGTTIILFANHSERSTFAGWTGCTHELSATECEVEMTAAKSVKAEFAPIPQQTLTVATEGAGEGTVTGSSPGGEFTPIECGNGPTTCEAEYNEGATITLFANRATHSKFTGWEGCTNVINTNEYTASECEVQMTKAQTVKAKFAAIPQAELEVSVTGPGEVTSSPPGIACTSTGGTCAEHFDTEGPEGNLLLTAIPAADYHVAWSGCGTANEDKCRVTMSAAKSVTADFLPTLHKLTVARTGSGEVTSSPAGIDCGEDLCAAEFQEGSAVVLTAAPSPHNEFLAWGAGQCKEEPTPTECEVAIGTHEAEVKAQFGPIHRSLLVLPTGGGSVSAAQGAISACSHGGGICTGQYDEASTVTLTAEPFAHSTFHAWGAGECKAEPEGKCEVEIGPGTTEVHADFAPNTHTLTVTPSGPGSVKATSGAITNCSATGGTCSGAYIETATVILTATPAPHQAVSWSGCIHSSEDTCEVQIGASDLGVQASFAQATHTLTLTKSGTGQGQVSCNGAPCASAYPEDTAVTLAATPAAGSTFAGWSGGGCSGTGTCKVTLEADTTITATFNAKPPPPVEEHCVVPALAGKALGQARSALSAAHCSLGTLTKPKKKGHLVVKSSSPAAGTSLPVGSAVNLKLSLKPKKKKH